MIKTIEINAFNALSHIAFIIIYISITRKDGVNS